MRSTQHAFLSSGIVFAMAAGCSSSDQTSPSVDSAVGTDTASAGDTARVTDTGATTDSATTVTDSATTATDSATTATDSATTATDSATTATDSATTATDTATTTTDSATTATDSATTVTDTGTTVTDTGTTATDSATTVTDTGTTVTDTGTTVTDTGTTVTDTGADTHVDSTVDTGVDTGTDTGVDSATDTGSDSGTPGTYVWKNVAIGGGGFVSGIVFSPAQSGLAYARTDVGGFYRWDNTNSVWVPLVDWLPASQGNYFGGESIAPDPTNANIVYAAGGMYLGNGNGVIMRSTDQGNTWTTNNIAVAMGGNATGRGMGERLAVDPANNTVLYFGTRNNGLYKSTNSATTWAQVASFPTSGTSTYGLPVVVYDKTGSTAAGSQNIYVAAASTAAGSNLYHTTNGGTSWSEITGGPTGMMVHHAALASDGNLWLAYSNDYGPYDVTGATLAGQIWKYNTSSAAWTNVTPPTANWGGMAGGLSVDAENAQHVVVSTLDWYSPDRLLATTNGGTAWTVVAQPPVSWWTGTSTYNDNGAAWWLSYGAQIGTGATNWVEAVALDPFNSNHVLYGTGGGIWASTNINAATGNGTGATWTFQDNGLEETVPLWLPASFNGAFLGAVGDIGGMRNANLDVYSPNGMYTNPIFSNTNAIDFAASNPNIVVRVGNSSNVATDVAVSADNGVTWAPCTGTPTGYTTDNEMQSVAVSANGATFVVSPYAGYGSPSYSTNNGASWTAVTGLPSGAIVASDRSNANYFYATSGGTLYVSSNGGQTFTTANTISNGGAPRPVFGVAGEVWVASNGNLYRFTNYGATKTTIATATAIQGVGFGKAASGQTHPAVFIIGTVGGQYGFYRSDDGAGATWTRMNDTAHQYGWLQGNYIAGDELVYGRVYLTTGGRGYVYGTLQ